MSEPAPHELPPKDPALFALAVLAEAWFVWVLWLLGRRVARKFLKILRGRLERYRSGSSASWRPEVSAAEVRETSHTTINWLEALAEGLEQLSE